MQRKDSILYRATKQDENSVTELLCNIMRDKYVRDILLFELGIPREVISEIRFDDISTQISLEERGKPDICIENKHALIYIENKIYCHTNIQDNQIDSYPNELNKSKKHHRQMIYLVPKEYKHFHLLANVCKQNTLCTVTHWENYLSNISKYEISASNPVFRECFSYFEDKLLQKSTSIKFKPEEIVIMYNPKDLMIANNYFNKLRAVIENAEPIIIKQLGNDFTPGEWFGFDRNRESESEKGKYLNYKNRDSIYYGLNFNIIREMTEYSDFFLAVDILNETLKEKNDYITRLEKLKTRKNIFSDNEWTYIKMDKYDLTEDDPDKAFANDAVEIIKALLC